jgi:molybdopterin-guanine dinucleotide biosynthesis protein A
MALADDLATFLAAGERRIQRWIEQNPNRTVTFPLVDDGLSGFDPFFNVNTPEDLAIAEDFVRERRP